jgi:4-hydroxy-tetrahydrodipicolinate reductase
MAQVRLAIHGAAGRMGQRLIALAAADPQLRLVAALESPRHPRLGEDAGLVAGAGCCGISLSDKLTAAADVMVDFSTPSGALSALETCLASSLPLVIATTGFQPAEESAIRAAARSIPILWSPNMSLAVNLLMKLSQVAAEALKNHPAGVDVEIIERHHRYKEDAPSGTALKFGELIAAIMGQTSAAHGRSGRPGKRPANEIGYHALRIGDNPGEHAILFGMPGEMIELAVRATSRDCYAQGALAAAKFLVGKPPGMYAIADVLRL